MEDILYTYGKNLYVNLTNRCPCNCTFCIRSQKQGLGSAETLWLDHDPSADEVIAAFQAYRLEVFEELIFCGYGEPFCALDNMLAVCRYIRSVSDIKIRVNTNGLGDLINGRETPPLLIGLVDTVSVSLNAPDAQSYLEVTRPSFGIQSFDAMVDFAARCKAASLNTVFSIVDVLPAEDIEACKRLSEQTKIPLRIRHFSGKDA